MKFAIFGNIAIGALMKFLICIMLVLGSVCSFADVNLGQKIEFISVSGKPQFGVQMTSDMFALTFSISGQELTKAKPISRILGGFVDKISSETLSDTFILGNYSSGTLAQGTLAFTTSLNKKDAKKVQSMLKFSALLLTAKDGDQTIFSGYVDLAQYCISDKNHFINLDSGENGCDLAPQPNVPAISACLSKVAGSGGWRGRFSDELPCLQQKSDYNKAMAFLCTKNQKDFSPPFKKYLDYEARVNAAFLDFKNAKNPGDRLLASQDLEDLKRQWLINGFKEEVGGAKSQAGSAHEMCFEELKAQR